MKKFFARFINLESVLVLIMVTSVTLAYFSIHGCSESVSNPYPHKDSLRIGKEELVGRVGKYGVYLIDLRVRGERHEYLRFERGAHFSTSHFEGCKYCSEK